MGGHAKGYRSNQEQYSEYRAGNAVIDDRQSDCVGVQNFVHRL